jgi:hypothetical protein
MTLLIYFEVKNTADLNVTKGGTTLTFEQQYLSLLLSASEAFDKNHNNSKFHQKKQHVYVAKIE